MAIIDFGVSYFVKYPVALAVTYWAYDEYKDGGADILHHRDYATVVLIATALVWVDYNMG